MKRFIFSVLVYFGVGLSAFAQQFGMGVQTPLTLQETVDQRAYEKVRDDNDRLCALIKVYLTNPLKNDLILEVGGLNVQATKKVSDDEIWFFVPAQVKNLEFRCSGYTRIPKIPVNLKEGCDYAITIRVDATSQTVFNALESTNFLKIKIEPSDAQIKIGKTQKYESGYMPVDSEGWFAEELDYGKWYFQIEHNLYQTYKGQIDLNADTKEQYIVLKPDYSLLAVNTEPGGADLYLQNRKIGITPYSSDIKLKRGKYNLRVLKDDYYSLDTTVVLNGDGQVKDVRIKLRPKFGKVIIKCEDSQAEIWIDKKTKVGVGSWEGNLSSMSKHIVEARKIGHQSQSFSLNVTEGGVVSKTISAPVPIYGNLKVNTSPKNCNVYVDGVNLGTSPFKKDLLVGEHVVRITREGYVSLEEKVIIEHNKVLALNKELKKGEVPVRVSISSVADALLFSDGKYLGTGNWTGMLSEGAHKLAATMTDCYKSEIDVMVSVSSDNTFDIPAPKRIVGALEINGEKGADVRIYTKGSNVLFESGTIPYSNSAFPSGKYEAQASKLKYESSDRVPFAVDAGKTTKLNMDLERVRPVKKWFTKPQGYASSFLDIRGGYDIDASIACVGLSYTYLPKRLGVYASVSTMGVNIPFISAGAALRLSDYPKSKTDWHVYAGAGYYDGIGFDFGVRCNLDSYNKWSRSSFGAGAMYVFDGWIPYVSTSLLFPFRGEMPSLKLETWNDYCRWFCDMGFGIMSSESLVAVGVNAAYVPGHLGFYASVMGGDYTQFTGGLVYRVSDESSCDFQLYAGSGAMDGDVAFDFGTRIAFGTNMLDCLGFYVGGTMAGGYVGVNFGFSLLLVLAVASAM